jgi:uncharacterized protein YbaR (Trm112 family)
MVVLLHLLCCPACRADVAEHDGVLACVANPRHRYPVIDGVPRFVSSGAYAATFGHQWNRWSETQLDSRNGTTLFHDRFRRYV